MLLKLSVILDAAESLLLNAVLYETEDRDSVASLPPGMTEQDVVNQILETEGEQVAYVMGYYVGRIGSAWGNDVALVFHHAGLLENDEDSALALYRLVMSCCGEGVGLMDDHENHFEKAKKVFGNLRPTPTHFGDEPLRELVSGHLVHRI